jgi:hypothetical protein
MADGYDGSWHEPGDATDFFGAPEAVEGRESFVSYLQKIADSYPHDANWQNAVVLLHGYMTAENVKAFEIKR